MRSFFSSPSDELYHVPDADELERSLILHSLLGPHVPPGLTESLTRRVQVRSYARGELLYRRGSAADRIYFIVQGKIALSYQGARSREFGARDALGAIDALQNRPHAFDALLLEDSTLLELDAEDWLEFLEEHFDYTRELIQRIARALPPLSAPSLTLQKTHTLIRSARAAIGDYRASLGPRLALSFVERLAVLRACPPLREAGIQALARLAHEAEPIFLEGGEKRGFVTSGLIIVESGQVRAIASRRDGMTWTEELSPGGTVAGVALLEAEDTAPSSVALPGLSLSIKRSEIDVEVEALEPSVLLRLAPEHLFDVMEDHFGVALSFLAYISRELEAQAIEDQNSEISNASWPLLHPIPSPD